MAVRDDPYGAFNFMVNLGIPAAREPIAGFSDVSGLGNEVKFSEYRNGNDPENHVRKIANINTTDDVILKRGRDRRPRGACSAGLSPRGMGKSRSRDSDDHAARRTAHRRLPVGTRGRAKPSKWAGPSLTAKGGGEVAMEELHLVAESIEFKPAP